MEAAASFIYQRRPSVPPERREFTSSVCSPRTRHDAPRLTQSASGGTRRRRTTPPRAPAAPPPPLPAHTPAPWPRPRQHPPPAAIGGWASRGRLAPRGATESCPPISRFLLGSPDATALRS